MVLGQILAKMTRREIAIFIFFSNTYTCPYVVLKVSAHSDQNWIFYKFLKLLKNRDKVPVLFIVHGLGPNFGKND